MPVDFSRTRFVKSVAGLEALPADTGREVAFVGRSNAGKSSVLNALAGIRGLARASKTPGRTQLINYFSVAEGLYLVDLPGYGYARAAQAVQKQWGRLVESFFSSRRSLKGLVLVMDVRRPFSETDVQLLDWLKPLDLPVLALLNKADKISRSAALAVMQRAQPGLDAHIRLQLFSAHLKTGVEDTRQVISDWLSGN